MTGKPEYTCVLRTPEETKHVACILAAHAQPGDTIALTGDLGAGKTQFVQGLAQGLGVAAAVISPTFNIVLTYEGARLRLHHFDWYRLDDADELEDIGFYEYLEDDGVSCIEWADKFPAKLPDDHAEVSLIVNAGGERELVARSFGERHGQLLCAWAADANMGKASE